jgi:hypothetical protein
MKRTWIFVTTSILFLSVTTSISTAATLEGTSCNKLKANKIVSGYEFTCIKSKQKLVWSTGPAYEKFAAQIISDAKSKAANIMDKAKRDAASIKLIPNCDLNKTKVSISIGTDWSITPGVRSIKVENLTNCLKTIEITAGFYCPSGGPLIASNTIQSTGRTSINPLATLYISLNLENIFSSATQLCTLRTGFRSNFVIINPDRQPSIRVISSRANYSQSEANNLAAKILTDAKITSSQIITNAQDKNTIKIAFDKAAADKEKVRLENIAKLQLENDKNTKEIEIKKLAMACELEGKCSIGGYGPGGGIIFYDAGSEQWWGRYLEVAPIDWEPDLQDWTVSKSKNGMRLVYAHWCKSYAPDPWGGDDILNFTPFTNLNLKNHYEAYSSNLKNGIGDGMRNTRILAELCPKGPGRVANAYHGGGKFDWYLPTDSEFDKLCMFAFEQSSVKTGVECNTFEKTMKNKVLDTELGYVSSTVGHPGKFTYWFSRDNIIFTELDWASGGLVIPIRTFSGPKL